MDGFETRFTATSNLELERRSLLIAAVNCHFS